MAIFDASLSVLRSAEAVANKTFAGLNFYGNFYRAPGDGGPVLGHDALTILDEKRSALAVLLLHP